MSISKELLAPANKQFIDGTHRVCSLETTLASAERFSTICGITRLANVTGLDNIGIPVYQCIRPNSRTLSVSQGKGATPNAARASALMESIEGWHAEKVTAASLCTSREELIREGNRVVDLSGVARRIETTPLDSLPFEWLIGEDLCSGNEVFVPRDLVSIDRTVKSSPIFVGDSNGLASGNTMLEAVIHAACEIIERDAHVLWHFDTSDPIGINRAIDLSTVRDISIRMVLDMYSAAGVVVGAQELTTDIGISCFQVVIIEPPNSGRVLGYSWGQGCHVNREVALMRALTEAAQVRLTFIAGSRDDLAMKKYEQRVAESEIRDLIELVRGTRGSSFETRESLQFHTLNEDWEYLKCRLLGVGITSIIAVDLRKTEIGIPVVKLVIPGLEGALVHPNDFVPRGRAMRATEILKEVR